MKNILTVSSLLSCACGVVFASESLGEAGVDAGVVKNNQTILEEKKDLLSSTPALVKSEPIDIQGSSPKSRSSSMSSSDSNSDAAVGQSLSQSPHKVGALFSFATRGIYNLTSNADVERRKFPNLYISDLLKFCSNIEDPWGALVGKSFSYETSSVEYGADYYAGLAIIESIDYGAVTHTFLGAEKGFSPTVDHKSLRDEIKPQVFLKKLIDKNQDLEFHKGTPYKQEDTKTRMEYIGYNSKSTRYVKVKMRREKQEGAY